MEYYALNLLGITRYLPIVTTASGITIAGFNPLGDTEVLEKVCADLSEKTDKAGVLFDVVVTTECKGIPFAHELAKKKHVDYVVFRKLPKIYLGETVSFAGGSITSGEHNFYLSRQDSQKLAGKRVLFADDVFSTGKTFDGVASFLQTMKAQVVGIAVALVEGKEINGYKGIALFCSGFVPIL